MPHRCINATLCKARSLGLGLRSLAVGGRDFGIRVDFTVDGYIALLQIICVTLQYVKSQNSLVRSLASPELPAALLARLI